MTLVTEERACDAEPVLLDLTPLFYQIGVSVLTEEGQQTVRFGPYEADFRHGELRKFGTRLKIQGRPLAVLALLVKRPGETVLREELRAALWPNDVFVDFDKNLTTAVNKLRQALCDTAESPQYIETVPRIGYRFMASVEVIAKEPIAEPPSARIETPPQLQLPSVTAAQDPETAWIVRSPQSLCLPQSSLWC